MSQSTSRRVGNVPLGFSWNDHGLFGLLAFPRDSGPDPLDVRLMRRLLGPHVAPAVVSVYEDHAPAIAVVMRLADSINASNPTEPVYPGEEYEARGGMVKGRLPTCLLAIASTVRLHASLYTMRPDGTSVLVASPGRSGDSWVLSRDGTVVPMEIAWWDFESGFLLGKLSQYWNQCEATSGALSRVVA